MGQSYLRFWGVRGSHSAPFDTHLKVGGNTSCVEIRDRQHVLICDAGTGIIPFGESIMDEQDINELLIILTHYHWDHICGLPFFLPAFSADWNIRFFGPGYSAKDIETHISAQMRAPYFPVGTETWLANINCLEPTNTGITHGPISLSYKNVHHPGLTYGYRITVAGKDVLYVSDNECLYLKKSVQQEFAHLNDEERTLYNEMQKEEHGMELKLLEDADILIHDAQYTSEDYEKKKGWGHSCYVDTVNTSIDAGVKELYLYHHDPHYDDDAIEQIHEHAIQIIQHRRSSMKCHIAREGLTVEL